jgi:hypothetical protein
MGERVFVLYKLKDSISRDDYARWLREEHYPWGRANPSAELLEGFFVSGTWGGDDRPSTGGLTWDNIAIIDISSRESWEKDHEGHVAKYHWEKWQSFVESWQIVYTTRIDA